MQLIKYLIKCKKRLNVKNWRKNAIAITIKNMEDLEINKMWHDVNKLVSKGVEKLHYYIAF